MSGMSWFGLAVVSTLLAVCVHLIISRRRKKETDFVFSQPVEPEKSTALIVSEATEEKVLIISQADEPKRARLVEVISDFIKRCDELLSKSDLSLIAAVDSGGVCGTDGATEMDATIFHDRIWAKDLLANIKNVTRVKAYNAYVDEWCKKIEPGRAHLYKILT